MTYSVTVRVTLTQTYTIGGVRDQAHAEDVAADSILHDVSTYGVVEVLEVEDISEDE